MWCALKILIKSILKNLCHNFWLFLSYPYFAKILFMWYIPLTCLETCPLLGKFCFRYLVAVFHISVSWFSQSRQKYFLCYLKQRLLSSVIFIVFEHPFNYSPYLPLVASLCMNGVYGMLWSMLISIDWLSEGPGLCNFPNKKWDFGVIEMTVPVVASYLGWAVDARVGGKGIHSSENRKSKDGKTNPFGRIYSLHCTPPVHLLFCLVY